MDSPAQLYSIAFSHYCEKARWALQRTGTPFREHAHIPLFHLLYTLPRGGRTVPLLKAEGRPLADSTEILRYADTAAAPDAKLYPVDAAARAECEALEDYFDEKLGPASRRLAYFHLLPEKGLLMQLLRLSSPAWEQHLTSLLLPGMIALMKRGMKIDEEGARRSKTRVDEAFERVGTMLGDGRRYLLGDTFTAADLTFAALAAPVILPPQYGCEMPSLDETPPAFRALVDTFRATPAGAFAMRLYATERQAPRS